MAGTLTPKHSRLYGVQRFFSWRPVTALLAPILHHVDMFILRLSGGKWDITHLSGLPVIELTTTGAKSGQPRTLPLAGLPDGDRLVLIASNFGREHNPAWYYNLKAYPKCSVKRNGQAGAYIARETEGDERERYWNLAISYYLGFEAYKRRAAHRKIPVMVLDPITDKHG